MMVAAADPLCALSAAEWWKSAAHDRLLSFAQWMFPGYQVAPHHERIARQLEQVAAGNVRRLVVTMPPRHGKSLLCSELFPAWFLGRNPDKRIIACSHTSFLAYAFSRRARNLLSDPRWPFAVEIAPDLGAVQAWDIADHRGGYIAAGVGGAVTGHGANVLLIDDPVASAEQADSLAYRDRAWEWYQGTAATRLEPNGAVIVIGTRWHEDDLIGRLLASGNDWTVLHLPAISADGAALWPERFDVAALAAIKREIGSRQFTAQYQGAPSPDEGGILKRDWWRFYRELPSDLTGHCQSWDMTFRETQSGSYIVGQVWASRGADRYLLDQARFRGDFPAAQQAMLTLSAKWPQATAKLVEDKANGPAIVASLRGHLDGLIEISPAGGKLARANAIAPLVEAGNVYLPEPSRAPWVGDLIEEAAGFPNAAHDDQVDCLSQALSWMRQSGTIEPVPAQTAAALRDWYDQP